MDPHTCRALGFRPDGIIDLQALGLSPEAIERRRHFIGGSDATIIAGGDAAKINKLARFKRGLEPAEDLSHLIFVMLGLVTEPFILGWAERQLGIRVERRGEEVVHRRHQHIRCTLDGWAANYNGRRALLQVKHVNQFSKEDEVVAKYTPQVQHELMVSQADVAILIMMIGTMNFVARVIEHDPVFQADLLAKEASFWAAVQEGRDPEIEGPILTKAEAAAGRFEECDMSASNAWGDAADRYLKNQVAYEAFTKATADLKALVPATAKMAFGKGVQIKVDKKNAMSVSKMPPRQEAA